MKKKEIYKIIELHLLFFILGSSIFVALFSTPLFGRVNVFFYRGIELLIVSTILIYLFFVYVKRKKFFPFFTWRDVILSISLIFCLNLVFFTHLPVTADRSVSVFLLGYMSEHPNQVYTKNDLQSILVDKYVHGEDAIGKRIHEQIASGDIEKMEDGFVITSRGETLMAVYRSIANIFGIGDENVNPR